MWISGLPSLAYVDPNLLIRARREYRTSWLESGELCKILGSERAKLTHVSLNFRPNFDWHFADQRSNFTRNFADLCPYVSQPGFDVSLNLCFDLGSRVKSENGTDLDFVDEMIMRGESGGDCGCAGQTDPTVAKNEHNRPANEQEADEYGKRP
jgi:hypothetical protein